MNRIEVHNVVSDFDSYRAARVKSLFNAESGCNFDLIIDDVDLSGDWNIGIVVGASGSGKTSIGKQIFGENKIRNLSDGWNSDRPIIDDIAPNRDFNLVTGLLASLVWVMFLHGLDLFTFFQTVNNSGPGLQG